jgi:hypothetical protein
MARPSLGTGHIVLKGPATLQAVEAIHAQFQVLDDRPAIIIDCSAAGSSQPCMTAFWLSSRS